MRHSRGFTIVEMVVYIGALVLVLAVVVSLLLWVIRANSRVYVTNEVVANVEHALSRMTNEIREAQSVYDPTTTTSQLSLQTRKNVPVGQIFTYVDFFLCDTRLCVKRESQTPQAITSDKIEVQSIEFTQVKTGVIPSIRIVVNASYLNPTNRSEFNASQQIQATASLRAY